MIRALTGAANRAAAASSAPTHLGERLAWTAVLLAGVAGVYLLMWKGWRGRQARQAGLPPLPEPPAERGAALIEPVTGSYVSSTSAGDWLDRIGARGLGMRGRATVHVTSDGVFYDRTGEPAVFVPADRLRGVRRERGMAGTYVNDGGLVVVTWEHGDRLLDTGFRAGSAAAGDALGAAVGGLVRGLAVSEGSDR